MPQSNDSFILNERYSPTTYTQRIRPSIVSCVLYLFERQSKKRRNLLAFKMRIAEKTETEGEEERRETAKRRHPIPLITVSIRTRHSFERKHRKYLASERIIRQTFIFLF